MKILYISTNTDKIDYDRFLSNLTFNWNIAFRPSRVEKSVTRDLFVPMDFPPQLTNKELLQYYMLELYFFKNSLNSHNEMTKKSDDNLVGMLLKFSEDDW